MFSAYKHCVKSKTKISDIKLTVFQPKKCPNSRSEMKVRKWHTFIISSHFSSKIGHVKIKLETTLVLGYFYTACSGRCRPFCIFIYANGDPLRLHYGTYWKPLKYKPYFHWSISDYIGSQCRENETTARYHEKIQQLSSIDVSVNE